MAKYYEIKQVNPIGHGYMTVEAIVINPVFETCGIRATKVGEPDGADYYYTESGKQAPTMYLHVNPREIMITGNATCEERLDYPFSDNEEDNNE